MQMRAEGEGTPYVVMWMNDDSLFDVIYQHFYGVEKWKDCFVFLETASQVRHALIADESCLTPTNSPCADVRSARAGGARSVDVIPEVSNKNTVSTTAASRSTSASPLPRRKPYMSLPTAHGRAGGVCSGTPSG